MRIVNTATGVEVRVDQLTDAFRVGAMASLGVKEDDTLTVRFVSGQPFIRIDRTGEVLTVVE